MTPKKKTLNRLALFIALGIWLAATIVFTVLTYQYARAEGQTHASRVAIWGFFFAFPALLFFLLLADSLKTPISLWRRLLSAPAALLMLLLMVLIGRIGLSLAQSFAAATCHGNTVAIGMGVLMYAGENGGLIPPADSWVDATLPYTKNIKLYKCPADFTDARCSYALNTTLTGVDLEKLRHPYWVVLLYDTNTPGQNPSGGKADFPSNGRHHGYIRVIFVDGQRAAYNPATKTPPLEWELIYKTPPAKAKAGKP